MAARKSTTKARPGRNSARSHTEKPASASAGKTRAKARKAPKAVIPAATVRDDTLAALCIMEVTLHSLESQEIGTPEQEVLKLALKTLWKVHDVLIEFAPDDDDDDDEGDL